MSSNVGTVQSPEINGEPVYKGIFVGVLAELALGYE